MDVKDKVILITGASSGIGLATARLLAAAGSQTIIASRSLDQLHKLSQEIPNSTPLAVDMTQEKQIKEMVKMVLDQFGRLDILINNAGRGHMTPVASIDLADYRHLFELNVIGQLVAMQQVIPPMKQQGGGMVVNISSGTALGYYPGLAAYSSTKRALNALALTAREELKADHIVVSVVYPYITDTAFYPNMLGPKSGFNPDARPGNRPPPDPPEFVAQKILETITTEVAEMFVHDWMRV